MHHVFSIIILMIKCIFITLYYYTMKNVIATSVLAITLVACSSSQKDKKDSAEILVVPENVQRVFKQHFPNVRNVKWEKEGQNYEAVFAYNVTETSMVITPKGEIMETETELDSSTLPESILTYLDNNYKGYKIAEASRIVTSEGKINYEAEVNDKDFIFDSNGNFLRELN